jgi:hypothetical protein
MRTEVFLSDVAVQKSNLNPDPISRCQAFEMTIVFIPLTPLDWSRAMHKTVHPPDSKGTSHA